jgi:hypothetical protein
MSYPACYLVTPTWPARSHWRRSPRRAPRKDGLPPLVAVDETVVEPSAQAVRAYLGSLGTSLSYPVALDTTGRVADGYGVQDQPWLALVSASGKIIWSHDGWLPVPALTAAVQHAVKP